MNFDSSYLVAPIIGAIIGYFTNWLAIKMVFRPHNEKIIFGIKIPFTPGIMPKRRFILAKKVGDAVSEYVLTEKALNKEITSNEAIENIKVNIDDIFENIKTSDKTVDEFLIMLLKEKKHDFVLTTEKILQNSISNALKSQYLKDEIKNIIFGKMDNFLSYDNLSIFFTDLLEEHKEEIVSKINEFLQSDEFKRFSSEGISNVLGSFKEMDESFSKYIPDDAVIYLKEQIGEFIPTLPEKINIFLEHNPEMDQKLDKLVQKIANGNINKLALVFVNKEKIYTSLKTELLTYLSDPINQADINVKISVEIDKFLNKNIKEISSKIPNSFDEDFNQKFQNIIDKMKNEKSAEGFLGTIVDKFSREGSYDLYESLNKYFPDLIFEIKVGIEESISGFFGGKAISMTYDILDNFKHKILDKKVCTFFENMTESEIKMFKENILEVADFIFLKGANFISKSINISRVVEVQINEFDLETAEDIIQTVINKELKAITNFGGILGFLIGLSTVIFQNVL